MGKASKSKKKAAEAAAKKKEMEELAAQEQAAVENELEFQKTCLEIRVRELETLNLGLQRKSEFLENQNEIFKTQLEEVREEKDDLVAHLKRCYSEEKTNVKELEDRLYGTHLTLLEERKSYENKLADKDKNLKETEELFNKKIRDLEAELTALEEFRIQRKDLREEKDRLERLLENEKDRFQRNYDELENNVIRYREKIKNESIDMVKTLAVDIQNAGKLCLTATVKSAINKNITLQEQVENVSKVNLSLREKLGKLNNENRSNKMKLVTHEEENKILHKKTHQYRQLTQDLVDRMMLMENQLKEMKAMEEEFISVKAVHSLCPSDLGKSVDSDVNEKLEKIQAEKISKLENEVEKLRCIIIKLAVTSKALSQARNSDETTHYKNILKKNLISAHDEACMIPNLPEGVQKFLNPVTPDIMPYMKYM